MKGKYVRIGTDYYKIVAVPLLSGDKYITLVKWKKAEIITDHGKDFLTKIEKFDGYCLIPSHEDYSESVAGFYNRYEKTEHTFVQGQFPKTMDFLIHIFGDQLDLFFDYLTILWKHPTQILPILCLVSNLRNTGKTTFLKWLKLIFQGNMTINKNEDFRGRFNIDWAHKLIIAVDEALLDKREDSEKIKNLSTATSFKSESKGVDKIEGSFIGKFILCSNNETNFIYVDKEEIRYWVIKVSQLKKDDPDLLYSLENELPHFMDFLRKREIITQKKTRMWFTIDDIKTEALGRLMEGNKTHLDKELKEIILDDFYRFDVSELKYSLGDLVDKLSKCNIRTTTAKVSEVLRETFGLESKNGSYTKYFLSQSINGKETIVDSSASKGRYFTFKKVDFL